MRAGTLLCIPYHQLHHHHPYLFQTIVESRDPMQNHLLPSSHPIVLPVPRSQRIVFPVPGIINQVWHKNLGYEFKKIRNLLFWPDENHARDRCFLASIDTEFPGVLSTSDKGRLQDPHYNYEQMKYNVNATNIIQLGLTLSDRYGNFYTWEFNFSDFDIETDDHNDASIELLKTHGIDFERNKKEGIPSSEFAELCRRSGLVGNNSQIPLTWVGFQSSYDFGFFSKILTGKNLPDDMEVFMRFVKMCFGPSMFDIKHMITSLGAGLYGGLEKVAEMLGVAWAAGKSHTAGSDSLLTLKTFIELVYVCLEPAYSNTSCIETLQNFTMNMSFANAMAPCDIDKAKEVFEFLIRGEEEREKQNYDKLYSCKGLKGLCI
ncbi:PREDICTED: probable CCR4-associated factor 1 homolog 11 [Fragaria vesca subsp. vesca]|uniref:probable CCR4-associated factor 1 homolog 11 n=1 Tax=Fragaria vesca subsp. vesca TaxID=101020 RepID=UPI0002C34686|nr:PREDICTED: probable CCR4-associated factor 1 homolog 11 [Fragaria vesca subsp. vesca]